MANGIDNNQQDLDAGGQLAAGFRWLKFAPGLEKPYRAYQRAEGLPQLRIALTLGFIFGLSFLAMDFFLGEPGLSSPAVLARFIANQSFVITMLLATFIPTMRPFLSWFGVLVCLNLAVSSLFVTTVGQARGISLPYTGFLVLTFYTYFFVGLRFWPALWTSMGIFAAVAGVAALRDVPLAAQIYNGGFLWFSNLIGATGLYNIEYNRRKSYLEARELEKLAGSDPLTGLANRGTFTTHLDRTWRHGKRTGDALTVAMVDVDYFKKYNDRYGHQAGDRALQRIAALVAEVGSRPLDLAGRYGGEEFVLVLPGCTLAHARERLQNLRRDVEDLEIEHADSELGGKLTISAGIAQVSPQDTDRSADGLVQMADQALYSAKQQGRNRVVIAAEDPDLQTGIFRFEDLRVPG